MKKTLCSVLALDAGLDIYTSFMGWDTGYCDGYGSFQVKRGIGCVPGTGLALAQK